MISVNVWKLYFAARFIKSSFLWRNGRCLGFRIEHLEENEVQFVYCKGLLG